MQGCRQQRYTGCPQELSGGPCTSCVYAKSKKTVRYRFSSISVDSHGEKSGVSALKTVQNLVYLV